ncbi:Efflux pump membrane transporter BepE [Rosistilla oblonga]|uniref:Efflux pump membrane transporter BepE n=1 Tax=Rosistilla oblonga TaxID=2527990 RepID=A0A518ISB6_9BACT|nr:efflux RND transporter permease subunit [Rosistilla oblonga]QDV12029.1 Efflux pump membrane transporter BepE [Rosistilla oblonga]QDV55979.1 Efflux pump membrane transporter BepE [Rosistilla oblonga]
MKSFTDIFIRHPVLAIVVNLILVLVGIRCALSLPIQQFPKLESTSITVTTVYFGASAETVRGFLTTPIERAVSSIAGIDYVESSSIAGISTVTLRLNLNHDSTKALAEVNARLQQVRSELPAEAEPPSIELVRADRPYATFYLSFTSDRFDLPALTDYLTRNVQPRLSIINGVQKVGIEAGQTPAMRIWISPQRLSELNLTPGDVYSALQRNNFLAAIGQVKNDLVQVDLLTNTDLRSVDEFDDLIVWQAPASSTAPGTIIRLSDVARVELGSEEPTATALYRGEKAIYVSVWPLPGSNEIEVATRLRAAMADLQPDLPTHVDMQLAYDGTKFMTKSLSEISKTLTETILIVGFVVFLFMGSVRTAIVPLVAMPVSLVGAAIVMYLMGFSLNLLTLLAIVLAVGLVVDDAIVVVENVQRHLQEGNDKIKAALMGSRELVGPILAMTITLATVYAPIGFQGGLTGMLFREFAFTLAAAVVVSGIVAVTLSPIMSAYLVPSGGREGAMTRFVNRMFAAVRDFYGKLLGGVLQLRWSIALATLLAGAAAVPLYMFSPKELAPVEDEGAVAVMLTAAPDSTLASSTRWTQQLSDGFQGIEETDYMWAVVTASGGFGGLITKDWDDRQRNTQAMLPEVFGAASQSAGLEAFPVLVPPLPGAGNFDVELVLKSDLPVSRQRELAEEIVKRGREANMFMFVDADLKVDLPQARVIVDRERLADLGLDQAAVGRELGVLLGGGYVNRFNYFNRSYRVIPQLEAADRQSTGALMDLRVRGPSGELIPVSTFASIEPETAPRTLSRFQQQSSFKVFAAVYPGVTKEQGLTTLENIATDVVGGSMTLDYAGESRQIRHEGGSLAVTLGFALLLIYLVLAAQFKSFRDPLIVLLGSVPLAMTGVLTLTCLDFTTINIYSQVGLITLVGLVAKNGILIVEFANACQESGMSKRAAILEASQTRLRPVLMTSAATILGHLPLVFVTGAGAQARNSIGIVLVAGMAVGTIFTLFVVPALYLILAAAHRHDTSEFERIEQSLQSPSHANVGLEQRELNASQQDQPSLA